MRRVPPLTYRGALQILGQHDRRILNKLDGLLGGVILGAGVAALGGPLVGAAVLFGWVDQKNEATKLVGALLDKAKSRLDGTAGLERIDLIAAAHTTIVAASFWEVFTEEVPENVLRRLRISEDERRALMTRNARAGDDVLAVLYESGVPAPSVAFGFEENATFVQFWIDRLMGRIDNFVAGLADGPENRGRVPRADILEKALARYRSRYIELAAAVPEFRVWSELGEHAATREAVRATGAGVSAALAEQKTSLARIEALLRREASALPDACATLANANRGALEEPLIADEAARSGPGVRFPLLKDAFIDPRFRLRDSPLVSTGSVTGVSNEETWEQQAVRQDIDLLLVAHLTSQAAHEQPMLLLGHPGGGKSLLTRVLAARLPAETFTVVRVPLRHVQADADVLDQIEQALRTATNGRVSWPELARESAATVRVILLDGLDELLQAHGARANYLQDIAKFQQREAEQGRPTAVIVTSRTLVADRVKIPADTVIVKLEDFDDAQIARWIDIWNETNAPGIRRGHVRCVTADMVQSQSALARQPLLLLLLALFFADPASPELDDSMSQAELYQLLMEGFAYREVAKREPYLDDEAARERIEEHLWRLTVAAFAMMNRGSQNVTDIELGEDLVALDEQEPSGARKAELGRRLLGEFFFVHAAEARPYDSEGESVRRSYEFLHATFGEYLVAAHIVRVLADLAETSARRRRGTPADSDDELFALLAHQPLSLQRAALDFAEEIFRTLDPLLQEQVLALLEKLVQNFRRRNESRRFVSYRPLPVDHLRRLAAYSVNLVLLRVWMSTDDSAPIDCLVDASAGPWAWPSVVDLWKSGLDVDCWRSVVGSLTHRGGRVVAEGFVPSDEIAHARLAGDVQIERWLRYGQAIIEDSSYQGIGDHWSDVLLAAIVPAGLPRSYISEELPPDAHRDTLISIANRFFFLLRLHTFYESEESVEFMIDWVLQHIPDDLIDWSALALAVAVHPLLLEKFERLWNPEGYVMSPAARAIFSLVAEYSPDIRLVEMVDLVLGQGSGAKGRVSLGSDRIRIVRMVNMLRDLVFGESPSAPTNGHFPEFVAGEN
ncbi:NACHT domain-containing protein [Actinomadura rayongensis]|uniref:ATP-binding protein n=1 Tax=Actinomadura rayongensis TaxID=1429076 RepID=A0A6I4WL62_9ACTN|nr:AAA family ATPase [Actinomadura rayongensis]MXQ67352.1 ATP-binding protein [Actinomadura rayongensis]